MQPLNLATNHTDAYFVLKRLRKAERYFLKLWDIFVCKGNSLGTMTVTFTFSYPGYINRGEMAYVIYFISVRSFRIFVLNQLFRCL